VIYVRLIYTDEMNELRKIFEPYKVNGKFIEKVPAKAVKAEKKFMQLFKEMHERNSRLL